jgi:hypothetical protein
MVARRSRRRDRRRRGAGAATCSTCGDFPTLDDPRHAQAYSPLWDAQLGLWTDTAVKQGLNKRQIDEVQVFNLAATRPDLLTGVDPATGKPAPCGAVGVDINCAVIRFIDKAPTANLSDPVANSQFPPRQRTAHGQGGGSVLLGSAVRPLLPTDDESRP